MLEYDNQSNVMNFLTQFFGFFATFSSNLYLYMISLIAFEIRRKIKLTIKAIKSENQNFKKVSKLILKVHKSFELFNKLFAFILLILIAQLVVGSTFEFFEIFSILTSPNVTSAQVAYSLISLQWWTYLNFLMIFMMITCGILTSEGGKIRSALYIRLKAENNLKARKKLKVLILLKSHIKLAISCGIFEFDWKTIQMVSLRNF